jgi:DNA-binding CsgD family transcriptional regulator
MFNIKVFPDFQQNPTDAESERSLLAGLQEVKTGLGAEYANASYYDYRAVTPESIHFLTYPLRWITHYVTNFFSEIDPLFNLDFRSVSMLDWQDVYAEARPAVLLRSFTEQGLGSNGLTMVTHVERDVYCVLSVTFDVADHNWEAFKTGKLEELRFQANRLGSIYKSAFLCREQVDFKITPRERECLYWVAMGKTDDQIATLLNIGKWTVTGHMQSAKFKLQTSTRAATVAKALVAGIIQLRQAR